jgi:hypothetical protein
MASPKFKIFFAERAVVRASAEAGGGGAGMSQHGGTPTSLTPLLPGIGGAK